MLRPIALINCLSLTCSFELLLTNYLIWSLQIGQLFNCSRKPLKRLPISTTLIGSRRLNKINRSLGKLTQHKKFTLVYGQYSRMWIRGRMLMLSQFRLFGLTSNRERYNVRGDELNAMLGVNSSRSSKFKSFVLWSSIDQLTSVTKKLYSFFTWLREDKIQYFAFNFPIHFFDIKQQNFVTSLNTLLFLDVKKPLRNFPTHNYLETIASLSKFASNFQTPHLNSSLSKSFRFSLRKKFSKKNLHDASTLMRTSVGNMIFFTKQSLFRERSSFAIKRLRFISNFMSRKSQAIQFNYSTFVKLYTWGRSFFYLSFHKSFKRILNTIRTQEKVNLVLLSHSTKRKIRISSSYNDRNQLKFLFRSKMRLEAFWFSNVLTTSHFITSVEAYSKFTTRSFSYANDFNTNKVLRCLQCNMPLVTHFKGIRPQLPTVSGVSIVPKYSLRFKRSLFFFLLLLCETKWVKVDWLSSVYKYSPFYSFTLFPSASNFKVSIFKRLNLQKYLLTSQLNVYSHQSYKLLKVPVQSLQQFSGTRLTPLLYSSLRENFSTTQERLDTRYINNYPSDTSRYIHVRRLKFKPGYSRLWRESRSDIQEILEMRIKYQNRLTLRLHQLYRQQSKNLFTRSTVTVFFSLLGSQFSMDMWSTLELLKNELIYVNGKVCTNLYLHLFLHDLIQVVLNLKFYFLTRFLQNRVFLISSRINKIFYRKYRTRHLNLTSRMRKTLPWTFLHLQGAYTDILPYLEVDYFTLSSFVILDQRIVKVWLPIRAYALELNIINMYNWKYIT